MLTKEEKNAVEAELTAAEEALKAIQDLLNLFGPMPNLLGRQRREAKNTTANCNEVLVSMNNAIAEINIMYKLQYLLEIQTQLKDDIDCSSVKEILLGALISQQALVVARQNELIRQQSQ